jgi:hypothetical protein
MNWFCIRYWRAAYRLHPQTGTAAGVALFAIIFCVNIPLAFGDTETFAVALPNQSAIPESNGPYVGAAVDAVPFPTFDSTLGGLQAVTITVNATYQFDDFIEGSYFTNDSSFLYTGYPSVFVDEPSQESEMDFSEPKNFGIQFLNTDQVYVNGQNITSGYYSGTYAGTQATSSQTFITNELTSYETNGPGADDLTFFWNDFYPELYSGGISNGPEFPVVDDELKSFGGNFTVEYTYSTVPEPASAALLALTGAGLLARRRRIRQIA